MIDFAQMADALPAFFGQGDSALSACDGLLLTLELLAMSLIAGMALALPLALLMESGKPYLAWPVRAYSYVFRGTPMLVQLFVLYYGLAQFDAVRESWAWTWLQEAY